MLKKILFSVLLTGSLFAQSGYWITGYFQPNNGMAPSSIPWSNYTHVIHFEVAVPTSAGSIMDPWHALTQADIDNFISAGHAAGKKVLVSVKDNNGDMTAFASATASGTIQTFVNNIVALVNNANGTAGAYDGVDIDWEANQNMTQFRDLLNKLRLAMPSKLLTATMGTGLNTEPAFAASTQSLVDQYNLMCYDLDNPWFGRTWFNGALFASTNAPSNPTTCDQLTSAYVVAGVQKAKLGIGLPFYGRVWTGGCTAPLQSSTGCNMAYTPYRDLVANTTIWQDRYKNAWANNQGYFISIPAGTAGGPLFATYTDQAELQAAANWIKQEGFGGAMTFAVEYDNVNGATGSAQHPLSSALYSALLGGGTTAPATNPATAPAITSASTLPSATVGTAYSQTLTATGTAPLTWTVTGGALPSGLSLGSTTGTISGTPSAAGTFTFTVQASNAAGSNSVQFSLSVASNVVAPTITSASSLGGGTVGASYSQALTANGTAPITWSMAYGSLPPGLSLTSSGSIGGTPTMAGTFTFTVTAANSAGSASAQFSIAIAAAPSAPSTGPWVTIINPQEGFVSPGFLKITAAASSSVVQVQYQLDGIAFANVWSAPFAYNWDTRTVGNSGWHTLTALAIDAAGRVSTSAGVRIRVR